MENIERNRIRWTKGRNSSRVARCTNEATDKWFFPVSIWLLRNKRANGSQRMTMKSLCPPARNLQIQLRPRSLGLMAWTWRSHWQIQGKTSSRKLKNPAQAETTFSSERRETFTCETTVTEYFITVCVYLLALRRQGERYFRIPWNRLTCERVARNSSSPICFLSFDLSHAEEFPRRISRLQLW